MKNMRIELTKNLTAISDYDFAIKECYSFSNDIKINRDIRSIELYDVDMDKVFKKSAYIDAIFDTAGSKELKIGTIFKSLKAINYYNMSNNYLTHGIYPYKGKFHGPMIRFLLNYLGIQENEMVLDPFCGSNTTGVECSLLGINSEGWDISPISYVIGNAKTLMLNNYIFPNLDDIVSKKYLTQIFNQDFFKSDKPNINETFIQHYNSIILTALEWTTTSDVLVRKRNYMRALARNTVAFKSIVDDLNDLKNVTPFPIGNGIVKFKNILESKEENKYDGIITSPPYSIALDYIKNDQHIFDTYHFDIKELQSDFVGLRGIKTKDKISNYFEDMEKACKIMLNVVKPGKKIALVLGNPKYNKKTIDIVSFIVDTFKKLGATHLETITKDIWGTRNVMMCEFIPIFQKP